MERGAATAGMKKAPFGKTPDGIEYHSLYADKQEWCGAAIAAAVVSLKVPDRDGKIADVVLGYDLLDGDPTNPAHFGALIGRYGNRIAHGKFILDGKTYTLAKNNGENSLHGGTIGFDRRVWTARDISTPEAPSLELKYVSKDGEEGYPGTLSVRVVYTLTATNEFKIDYSSNHGQGYGTQSHEPFLFQSRGARHRSEFFRVKREHVAQNVSAALPREIEIGMVREIEYRILVRGC